MALGSRYEPIQRRLIYLQIPSPISYEDGQLPPIICHFPPCIHLAPEEMSRQLARSNAVLPHGGTRYGGIVVWQPEIYVRNIVCRLLLEKTDIRINVLPHRVMQI